MTGPARTLAALTGSALLLAPAAAQSPTRAERDFVRRLDEAWSTGEPRKVTALFRFLHPQAQNGLLSHLMRSTGGPRSKSRSRTSKIVRAFELKRSDGRKQRALFLDARIDMHARKKVTASFFEVLVFHPRGRRLEGVLLMKTAPDKQGLVATGSAPAPRPGDPAHGRPIGSNLLSRCPMCNYRVGTPKQGNWAIIARPSVQTNCLVGIDVYSLDTDLAMSLSIDVVDAGVSLPTLLASACKTISSLHEVDAEPSTPKKVERGGLPGAHVTMLIPGPHARRYELYAYRDGKVVYLLDVQGRAQVFERRAKTVRALLDTFQLLDPTKHVDPTAVAGVYGRPASFDAKGRLAVPSLSLRLDAPGPDWKRRILPGPTSFHAEWTCPKTGSQMLAVGIDQGRDWNLASARAWLTNWEAQRSCPTGLRDFSSGAYRKLQVAGRQARELSFTFRSGKQGRVKGFFLVIPHGRTLVAIQGRAMPSSSAAAQRRLDKLLRETARSITLR